jgi:3-deoxy-D-manno-octulosonate 8-phosphate phosphatase (KDO 8-P phosphatase)
MPFAGRIRDREQPTHMAEIIKSLADRCRGIEAIVLDVDGVLTDGRIVYGDHDELKFFHVRDGSGLWAWKRAGKDAVILSGRTSQAVSRRAQDVGVTRVLQGIADKTSAYEHLLSEAGWDADQVACIADDFPDLGLLRRCGLAVAVADACYEVRSTAHYVTKTPGGRGAVREAIELILRCQGRWQEIVESRLLPTRK